MQHLQLVKPVMLEEWQDVLRATDPATSFRDHAGTFGEESALRISVELKSIVDDFGAAVLDAVFAVRNGTIEALWIDPLHNYVAFEFSRAKGDEEDVVLTMSMSKPAD